MITPNIEPKNNTTMKKPIVVIPAVENKGLGDKYGGWNWMDISKIAWKYWCDKNNYLLVIYDKCTLSDIVKSVNSESEFSVAEYSIVSFSFKFFIIGHFNS